jgi:5'-nucleotidase
MAHNLQHILVIGVSSRALFDLEQENAIYNEQGLAAFASFQSSNATTLLSKGTAFPLVEALLNLNKLSDERLVEVVIMSKNSPDTGLRMMHAIEHFGLDISRAALTGGESLAPYLGAFDIDLFLSKDEDDIQLAVDAGVAAALLYNQPAPDNHPSKTGQVRFAFDADAVVFSDESEIIYKQHGLQAFLDHEKMLRDSPLNEGPFAKLIKMLSVIQQKFPLGEAPIRIAIVTARNSPAHIRVVKTLNAWGVYIDTAFFLGGLSKDKFLQAFKPHIFFDDQEIHLESASKLVPSAKVPYKSNSVLNNKNKKIE